VDDRDLVLVEALLVTLRLPLAHWAADALCREHPEVSWFPGRGQPTEPAKAVCRKCLCRADCAAYALDHEQVQGVWGSTSERDRARARKAGISGAELLAMLDAAPAPVGPSPYDGPLCGRCGGFCSRRDVAVDDGLCWACRSSLVPVAGG
jgi:WhiB family redox-sensing transcriptional regulator